MFIISGLVEFVGGTNITIVTDFPNKRFTITGPGNGTLSNLQNSTGGALIFNSTILNQWLISFGYTNTTVVVNGVAGSSGAINFEGTGGTQAVKTGNTIYLSQSSLRTEFLVYSNTSVTVPATETEKVIQKSGSGAITVTVPNGQRNGQRLDIKWGGTSNFTVQCNLYDSGANVSSVVMNSNSLTRLPLIWNSASGRWWLV